MNKILLIGKDNALIGLIQESLQSKLQYSSDVVADYRQIKPDPSQKEEQYFLAVLDLEEENISLEQLDYITRINIPFIVLIKEFNDNLRDHILTNNLADYIIKDQDNHHLAEQVTNLIHRLYRNQFIKIMVVDDSTVSRKLISELLTIQKFVVLEAHDSEQALGLLQEHTDVRLMIIDYNMPGINGFELAAIVRKKYSKNEMILIGISGYGSNILSAKFLKKGVNDFILKPFSKEEFCSRIVLNIEMLEYMDMMKRAINLDFLTDLNNRRYFFDVGEKLFDNAKRNNIEIMVAMIDIDNFKSINDHHGHHVGDMALKFIAETLRSYFRKADIVARFGGDEFCILVVNMGNKNAAWKFQGLQKLIEGSRIPTSQGDLKLTISAGVALKITDSLESTIKAADMLLYKAKSQGKNSICFG